MDFMSKSHVARMLNAPLVWLALILTNHDFLVPIKEYQTRVFAVALTYSLWSSAIISRRSLTSGIREFFWEALFDRKIYP